MVDHKNIKEVIEATTELTKAVPVYPDLIKPAAIELGKGLETVAKSVNVALAPLSGLVWGYDRIKSWLESSLTKQLKDVPNEKIITPDLHVVGPAVESLRFAANNENIRDMFAKLIATSMNKDVAESAHPTFVEILKQMSSDEAKIVPMFLNNTYHPYISIEILKEEYGRRAVLTHWSDLCLKAKCNYPAYASAYIENLKRLGILEFQDNAEIEKDAYDQLLLTDSIKDVLSRLKEQEPGSEIIIDRGIITRTMLGQLFMEACIGETSGMQATMTHSE